MRFKFQILVDGETFDVSEEQHPAGIITHFAWTSGPDPAYGFSTSQLAGTSLGEREAVLIAREFLSNVDPSTGHIPD